MTANPVLARKNVEAEIRGVLEGHQARLASDGSRFTVASDSQPGKVWNVQIVSSVSEVGFVCDCPAGRGRLVWTVAPCKHAARCARRMVRHGLLRWDVDRWRPTAAVASAPTVDARSVLGRFLIENGTGR